jgi:hypothetical protein
MAKKTFKQVCTCENCGNEAEMIVTCQWVETGDTGKTDPPAHPPRKVKGTGTCTQCGNEADTWVDL